MNSSKKRTMKAAVYDSFAPSPITVRTVPIPSLSQNEHQPKQKQQSSSSSQQSLLEANGVILQVMATGVCRSDWHGWKGHDTDIQNHGLPFVPGHELSGIIVEVGYDVHNFRVGDRVAVPFILSCGHCCECHRGRATVCESQEQPGFTTWGGFAEYVALPRADRNLRLLPSNVSFVEAAALGCRFATAYRAVMQRGGLDEYLTSPSVIAMNKTSISSPTSSHSDHPSFSISIAVFGCGGLGLACIMIAHTLLKRLNKMGLVTQIIAIDISSQALEKAKEIGATHTVLCPKTTTQNNHNDDGNYYQKQQQVRENVIKLTNHNQGADITIDAAGFSSTCENAVWSTRRGGKMVQVGLPMGGRPPIIPMDVVAGREIDISGSHGFDAQDLPHLLDLVSDGTLNVKDLIEREVTLEEGAQAIMDMETSSPLGMTIVTKFDSSSRL